MAESLKIIKIINSRGAGIDVLTRMPDTEIYKEVEYQPSPGDGSERDVKWCRLEGLNDRQERVSVAVMREDIRCYMILPWHPEQEVQVQQGKSPIVLRQ